MERSRGFGGATPGRQRKLSKPSGQKLNEECCRSQPGHKKEPVNRKSRRVYCQDELHDEPCFQHWIPWMLRLLRKTPQLNQRKHRPGFAVPITFSLSGSRKSCRLSIRRRANCVRTSNKFSPTVKSF